MANIRPTIGTRTNVKKKIPYGGGTKTIQFQAYIPPGFEGAPKNATDILKRARAACVQEGTWMSGAWFHNSHPEIDPEDAFCNNWSACADGLILMVSTGAVRSMVEDPYDPNYVPKFSIWSRTDGQERGKTMEKKVDKAREYMALAAIEVFPKIQTRFEQWQREMLKQSGYSQSVITQTNDDFCPSRKKALEWFDKAIELSEAKGKGSGKKVAK